MRRTIVAAVVAAALVGGAAAGAAVTAYDDDWPHPMMSGEVSGWTPGHPTGHMGGTWGGHHVSVASEQEYLAEMVAHHREAIDAARELRRSDRATMRRFGERIVQAQSAQVAQMEAWLGEWYADESTDTDYEPMMRDLTGLAGDRLDRTFLQDMVGHHMAAVMMSQHLLASGLVDHDEVAVLAADIRDDQHAEILRMRAWLRDWFGVGWMMP
ncbi:DUF305 domain-containing protein [Nocardioides sp. STR2]|uniref:DUF305 domain-containing protein n=1 Tax=Nocardioides pini TaxID=2975053 RepID=A0ABT4C9H6_9ACTN|nr:DUF305 domain-containing protein [Nocardioides pini]MCY4725623.1 DUF305 domain-containing protein [Nocardioides pini]